jgi:protein tyrosine/serine phosphatase
MNIEPLPADKTIGLSGASERTDRKLPSIADRRNNRMRRSYTSSIAIVASLNRFLATHRVGRFVACVMGVLLVGIGLAGGWAIGLQLVGNVHVVEDGILYRSAQLNGQKLANVVAAHGIKSVINLRGENRGLRWYDDEIEVTAAHGISHFDVRMSAVREPDDATVTQLMETLQTAPRPLLIHCESGSDRTGLAAALYERFVKQRPAEVAAGQISFRYGHFPWLGNRTVAMDRTYWRLSADGLPKSK